MHHIAGASLPVCIGLLILTTIARAGSRRYLEPLCTWCVVAAVVNAAAVVAAGDMDLLWLAPPVAVGCAALLLLSSAEHGPDAKAEPEAEPATETEARPPASPQPAPAVRAGGGLWARVDEGPQQRDGLWSSR